MTKKQIRKFREHYFPEKTITKSRALMCKQFGFSVRAARSWEQGDGPVQNWFDKASKDFDKDNVLEK